MTNSVSPILLVAAAALTDRRGRVLVQRRPPGKPLAGLWEFPGGKVEAGEAPAAALARELAEELGIGVDEHALAPLAFAEEATADERRLVLLLYRCRAWSGEPAAIHAEVLRWVAPGGLAALDMPPADRPLVAALAAQSRRRQ